MPKGVELSAAVKARLEQIAPGNGYNTELKAVYDDGSSDDTRPKPFALLRWEEDTLPDPEKMMLAKMMRARRYVVEAVFPVKSPLADLDRFCWDVVRALSRLGDEFNRVIPGQLGEHVAEIQPAQPGSTMRRVVITLQIFYTESYV